MKTPPRRDIGPRRWHHQLALQHLDSDPLRIAGLADAMSAAFAVAERFERAHASVALDESGFTVDFTCFTAARHSIDAALAWADCLAYNESRFKSLILISAGEEDVSTLADEDVQVFRSAQRVWTERGIPLIDWLKCNRDVARSLAISLGSERSYELIHRKL